MLSTNLLILFLIIIFSPIIGKILKISFDLFMLNKQFKNGSTLLELLNRLTPREFEIWSMEYLSSLGYCNVILTDPYLDKDKNIICSKNNRTIYVKCKNGLTQNKITYKDIEKLLGSMISNGIKEGIIITTCSIDNDIYEILEDKCKPYLITIIDFRDVKKQLNESIIQTT